MWVVEEYILLGPFEDDDDDAVGSVSVCALLASPCCFSVGDFKGSWVTPEVRSELSLSVLRWLLQEWGSFSPGARLTALPCGLRMVSLSQVIQEGSSGGEEVRSGTRELDTVG